MKFLEYIKRQFKVVVVDTEFQSDASGTYCTKALCAVYKDLGTGQVLKIWDHGQNNIAQHHFDFEKTLFVCHYATAEAGYFLKQLMGRPPFVFDCWIEYQRLYKGLRADSSLLACARAYEYPHPTSKEEKDYFRDKCIKQNTWSQKEKDGILDYCEKDVLMSEHVFKHLLNDIEEVCGSNYEILLEQALERGAAMVSVSHTQKHGMSIDINLVDDFNTYWPLVKDSVIQELNKSLGLWDEKSKFSHAKFGELLRDLGLETEWPLTPKGRYKTREDVFEIFEETYPEIKAIARVFKLSNKTKLSEFLMSEDGRYRPNGGFKMFGTKTSRCTPSSKWIFGTSKWTRNFLKPPIGSVLVYCDYKSEEPFIAAQLSGDELLKSAYGSGDIYIHTAKLAKLVGDNATAAREPEKRKIFKVVVLAVNYGMGSISMAKGLKKYGITQSEAAGLLKKYKEIYHVYFAWNQEQANHAQLFGRLETLNGWMSRFPKNKKVNPRSIMNWPIQATSADVLRNAWIRLANANIKVTAAVHDAFLIECPIPDQKKIIAETTKHMIDAARHIVGGEIEVDAEIITGNWIQLDKDKKPNEDQKLFDVIMGEIGKYKAANKGHEVTYNMDRGII